MLRLFAWVCGPPNAYAQAKPNDREGARAVLTLKSVKGDGSAWLVSKAGTDIVLLGPISNALAMIPTITTVAIEKTFARITRTDETYVG